MSLPHSVTHPVTHTHTHTHTHSVTHTHTRTDISLQVTLLYNGSVLQEKVVASNLLLTVLDRFEFVDAGAEVGGIAAECDVKVLEEDIHATEERAWGARARLDSGLAVKDDNAVGQVRGHDEVVLHNERRLLGVQDESEANGQN